MKQEIKLITYNIDGLPEALDLSTLPWVLKPLAWIYKLITGTTVIKINDNTDTNIHIKHISKCLSESNADIIGVQEDFNFHEDLMDSLSNDYNDSTNTGKIEISNLFSKIECITRFPLPRFKCDGLNLITKKNNIQVLDEKIVRWKKTCGYFKHANDTLTHKGFRLYTISAYGKLIDVYVVHMDADFYSDLKGDDAPIDIKARISQINQLTKCVIDRYNDGIKRPIIIMGDTNSSDNFSWDKENIQQNLIDAINNVNGLDIKEVVPSNEKDVDRIFIINTDESKYVLEKESCYYDLSFNNDIGRVSDHWPLVTDLYITKKS